MQDVREIEKAIEEWVGGGDGYWWELGFLEYDTRIISGVDGIVEFVEDERGAEGYVHLIFKITVWGFPPRWFKKTGCRVSHEGTYWDGSFTEVKPEEKVITVWPSVKH